MASKTIDHMDFYVDVTPYQHETVSDQTFNVINVCVAYRKGQGFVAYYHPGWNTDWGGFGCLFDFSKDPLTAGFTVPVEQATKNNVKRLTVMHESLKLAAEGIRYFFDRRDWQMLRWLLESTARVGYTPTIEAKVRECMEAETIEKTEDKAAIKREQSDACIDSAEREQAQTKFNNSNNNQNNSEDKVMTNETMKVADLIGKSISNGANAKYTINSIEGDKVSVTFQMGDSEGKPMTMGVAQVEKLLQGGWTVGDGTQESTEKKADGGSQKTEEPKAKTVTMGETKKPRGTMPKSKVTLRKKQPQAETETKAGKLTYSTYTNAKGKTCAKISGFAETDAAYQKEAAASLHGSATYENTKQGRVNFLLFGPRYAEVAKTVCQMLNEGKTVADCQAVVDAATEERQQKREEWKQKRAAYREQHEGKAQAAKPQGKTYTEAEVADLMRRVIAGDQEAMAIVNAMAA